MLSRHINNQIFLSIQNSSNSNAQSNLKCCSNCKFDHNLIASPQFLALSNNARLELIPNFKLYYNCFKQGLYSNPYMKQGCKICKRKRNTLIHVNDRKIATNVTMKVEKSS